MLGEIKDRAMKARDTAMINGGLIERVQTAEVAGTEARFHVDTANELHRVRTVAGELDLIERFMSHLQRDMVFWDVGAAVGTWSMFCGPHVRVTHAFEPHPGNASRIEENAEANRLRVVPRQVALSDRDGTQSLHVDGGEGAGTHRLSDDGMDVSAYRGEGVQPEPDAVKIDVEGHELQVLRGLGHYLDSVEVLIVECHPQHGVSYSEVAAVLSEHGLVVEKVDAGRSESYAFAVRE